MKARIVIVGGGIVGAATALALSEGAEDPRSRRHGVPNARPHNESTAAGSTVDRGVDGAICIVEAENALARHQSGRNSGVVHAGLYYPPGSLKAELCRAGREEMFAFCERSGVAFRRCGKLVVATRESELSELDRLEASGRANGLEIQRLDADGLREREPHCRGLAALWVPETGVVDFRRVVEAIATELKRRGVAILLSTRVDTIERYPSTIVVQTSRGPIEAERVVNCAGLQSDRVARAAGLVPAVRIVPFRGDYFELPPARRHLTRALIYPVPDRRYPFLGVHATRTVDDRVELGPNALWAWTRHGYEPWSVSLTDVGADLAYPGFWRFLGANGRRGLNELLSRSRRRFLARARTLIPELELSDLTRGRCGIRAQAIDRSGRMVEDFEIQETERMIHVLNAPSPAATASLAIGRRIAQRVATSFADGRPSPVSTT